MNYIAELEELLDDLPTWSPYHHRLAAIIAELRGQKPVAWLNEEKISLLQHAELGKPAAACVWSQADPDNRVPLYTAPPAPQPVDEPPEWLIELCMITEAVTPTTDIRGTVQKLIDWHVAMELASLKEPKP